MGPNEHLKFLQRRDSKGSPQYMGTQGMLRPISQLPDVVREPSEDTSGRAEVPALAQVRLGSSQSNKQRASQQQPELKTS